MRNAITITLAIVCLASATTPVALALETSGAGDASAASAAAVGAFFVDAAGNVRGADLTATLHESEGALDAFAPTALGAPVFQRVSIDGFAQAQKLHGVGTSALELQGTDAVLRIHDDAHAALEIATSAPTQIHYALAPNVVATAFQGASGSVRLGDAMSGRTIGWLVAVGADGASPLGDALVVRASEIVADAKAGSHIVFLARGASDAFDQAVASAAADGSLRSAFVTNLAASDVASSTLDLLGSVTSFATRASSASGASVSSHVSGGASSSLLAYDLAYETLPANAASDVAVFVDGKLAERADTPQQVQALAAQGIASYHAIVPDAQARALVLASVPSGSHDVTILADASGAATEAQARAEQRSSSAVSGEIELHGAKATGSFLTALLDGSKAALLGYTSLATQTQVFDRVALDGSAQSRAAADGSQLQLSSSTATLTLADDAAGTLTIDAQRPAHATFDLAPGVGATAASASVAHLTGPHDYAGTIIAGPGATLAIRGDQVVATLADGARVLVRSSTSAAFASDGAIANAIASGQIGAQLLAGRASGGATIATTHSENALGIVSNLAASGRGQLTASYHSQLDTARSFVVEQRGAASAIAAQSASDVRVVVDGAPAVAAPSVDAALSASTTPAFFAETASDGALRVLVNTIDGDAMSVAISSVANARAAANSAFGSFRVFDDGTAVGNFVSLRADGATGALAAFHPAALDAPVIASLAASGAPFASTGVDGATTLIFESRDARVAVSDTSDALLSLVAKSPMDATLQLGPGFHAVSSAAGGNVVDIVSPDGADAGSIILRGEGALRVGDQAGSIVAHLDDGSAVLYKARAGVERELSNAQRAMMAQAIARGSLAGEVMLQSAAAASGGLESSAVAGGIPSPFTAIAPPAAASAVFGDLHMITSAASGRVDITVDSATHVGKTILVTLDPASIPDVAAGKARILVDGVPTQEAASLADALDATDDAGVAESFVLAGDAGSQVLVSIPHFSVHTVTIQSAAEAGPAGAPISTYLAIILGLLTAAETAYLVRNHRRN